MTSGAQDQFVIGAEFMTQLGTLALPPGTTIGGLIVDFSARRAATSTVTESGFAWGVLPVGSGVAAPSPVSGQHDDWMWLESVYFNTDATLARVTSTDSGRGARYIKAMRRLDEIGMGLVLAVEPLVGAETVTAHFTVSTLLILP